MTLEHPSVDSQAPGANRLRVLVVDDDADTAASMALVLRLYGYNVSVAGNGPAALRAAGDLSPDVVLLDIRLPGMDGYEVARRLRDPAASTRPLLIAVSGLVSPGFRRASQEAGIPFHFVKPVDPEVLLGVLQRFEAMLGRPEN